MAVLSDSNSPTAPGSHGSSVDTNSTRKKVFPSTGGSSRKNVSNDSFENPSLETGGSVSNSEHIVGASVFLGSIAQTVESAAGLARSALTSVRASLTQQLSPNVKPNEGVLTTQLHTFQSTFSAGVVSSVSQLIDEKAQSIVTATAQDVSATALSNALPNKKQSTVASFTLIKPNIDYVEIDMDSKKGNVDAFFARVVYSIPSVDISSSRVKAVRIFRSVPVSIATSKRLTINGISRIASSHATGASRSGFVNGDFQSQVERVLKQNGVDNSMTSLSPFDLSLNLRTSSNKSNNPNNSNQLNAPVGNAIPNILGNSLVVKELSSFLDPTTLSTIDISVAKDVNTIKNIQTQNSDLKTHVESKTITVGRADPKIISKLGDAHASQLSSQIVSGKNITTESNSQQFKEIASFSPNVFNGNIIGDDIQFYFDDTSVTFGNSYQYFVSIVDDQLKEGVRSPIVQVETLWTKVPAAPDTLTAQVMTIGRGQAVQIVLSISSTDKLVEKFEIYRREGEITQRNASNKKIVTVGDRDGFNVGTENRSVYPDGFMQIVETMNLPPVGSTCIDSDVFPGNSYSYRIYSVDIFGNKSEKPKELDIYVPEMKFGQVQLMKPDMNVEIDTKTNKVLVTFNTEDSRIVAFVLGRRDASINQTAFTAPGQVNFLKMGRPDLARSSIKFKDCQLAGVSPNDTWTGYFRNTQVLSTFLDLNTTIDHTYQYRLYGVDKFGNQTPCEISDLIFVSRAAQVGAPVGLSARVKNTPDGGVDGIYLNWVDGNVSELSDTQLGNQVDRAETALKTLYQVERRRIGEMNWKQFQLTDAVDFFDPTFTYAGNDTSPHQPDFVIPNETYLYRVSAFVSGNLISNATTPVGIKATVDMYPPSSFTANLSDAKNRPLVIVLSWDDEPGVCLAERWEIQRASINNLASINIDPTSLADIQVLPYRPLTTVFLQSDNSTERSTDERRKLNDRSGISGKIGLLKKHLRSYCDSTIDIGNTYYYRLRSISPWNDYSEWKYITVKAVDFDIEQRAFAAMSTILRATLASSFVPINIYDQTKKGSQKHIELIPMASQSLGTFLGKNNQSNVTHRKYSQVQVPHPLSGALTPIQPSPLSERLGLTSRLGQDQSGVLASLASIVNSTVK